MKLLRLHIVSAKSCGGLLDGLDVRFRDTFDAAAPEAMNFEPLCLIGPNGAGKSQLIQVMAEAFQSLFHAVVPNEERTESNQELQFELEYLIGGERSKPVHVRATRRIRRGRKKAEVTLERKSDNGWTACDLADDTTAALLPSKVVGYTSGANETLSVPFLVSRSGYAEEVGRHALSDSSAQSSIPDTRLMLIDYGTHLEVLVSNLLLGTAQQREALLNDARVQDLHSFRCVVQLAHSAAPSAPRPRDGAQPSRKGIQLTSELEAYIDQLRRCATCYSHEAKTDTYIFDFFVTKETRKAFLAFWNSVLELYAALHKLAMLNDLAIPRSARERFKRDTQSRRFASRLPEPQDEDKVFRFERVVFDAQGKGTAVDYVSLSDGEHQQVQLMGTMCMLSFPGVLFLLDEPESHFNPQWRVKLLQRILDLPTLTGTRRTPGQDEKPSAAVSAALQDCLLTTHSPFVPSDMPRERVLIFSKDAATGKIGIRRPQIETFGTTFDAILSECFGINPPISAEPKAEIGRLMESEDPEEIRAGLAALGESAERIMLADRARQLERRAED
ncbi:MAG: restriction system-associated AAA family ATPase [Variovorax sp.]